jgi:serine/threonine protein kinase
MIGNEIGPYRLLEKIGEGGMGIVFRGIHIKLEQEVAIKALLPVLSSDPVMKERFINEAKIQARLSHPNVVNILNYLEEAGNVFLVMEFIRGETLEKMLIRKADALAMEEAIMTSYQVLDALAFMHSKGVIHRDIKPSNIMLAEDGRVKVTDFGIAKVTGEKGYTKTGVKIGTMWYMSPEVIKGQEATALSDIYSFGITLFQMVTGRVPFTGDSEYTIMKAHLEEEPPSPWEINPLVPREMGKIVFRAIAKDPGQRYQSAREFAESLKTICARPSDMTVIPAAAGDKYSEVPFLHLKIPPVYLEKRRLVLVLVGLVIVLLITIYLIFSWGGKPESGRTPLTQVPSAPPPLSSSSPQPAESVQGSLQTHDTLSTENNDQTRHIETKKEELPANNAPGKTKIHRVPRGDAGLRQRERPQKNVERMHKTPQGHPREYTGNDDQPKDAQTKKGELPVNKPPTKKEVQGTPEGRDAGSWKGEKLKE